MSVAVDDDGAGLSEPSNDEGDERFGKAYRLLKRPQFLHARRRGRRAEGRFIIVYAVANDVGHPRLGVTASRKVGNAVVRNRWKRRLREIFRCGKQHFGDHHDVVIIIKGGRRSMPEFKALERDVYKAVRRALASLRKRGKR